MTRTHIIIIMLPHAATVEVAGGLITMGDAHSFQGDGESCGNGVETSVIATIKVTVHKKGKLPKIVHGLNFPLLENAEHFLIHGLSYVDYVRELPNPLPTIRTTAFATIDRAMAVAYNHTRDW